jgi:hypothetical protein
MALEALEALGAPTAAAAAAALLIMYAPPITASDAVLGEDPMAEEDALWCSRGDGVLRGVECCQRERFEM